MTDVRRFTSGPLAPHDRGLELGERLGEDVTRTVDAYRRLMDTKAGGRFPFEHWGERAWATIEGWSSEQAAEISGIAAGAGLPVRDLAALNARTELLAIADPTGVADECSAVVTLPQGAPPVAVQTWDWYSAMAGNWFHWTIPHPDGRRVQTVTEFGLLGKIGVNDRGVGVLLTLLRHAGDDQSAYGDDARVGVPVHLVSRRILDEAASLEDVERILAAAEVTASTSLTVVAPDGAASYELFPGGVGRIEPAQGFLARTNHFVSEAGRPGCLAASIGPSTRIRRDALQRSFAARLPTSADEVVEAMRHHDEGGGVCRHPRLADDPVLRHATLATVRLDVGTGDLAVAAGGPCGDLDRHEDVAEAS